MEISDMILGMNKIHGKVSIAIVNKAGGLGVFWDPSRGFRGQSTVRKFLASKELQDWFKLDFNASKIISVEDYIKKINVNGSTCILKLRVKQVMFELKI